MLFYTFTPKTVLPAVLLKGKILETLKGSLRELIQLFLDFQENQ